MSKLRAAPYLVFPPSTRELVFAVERATWVFCRVQVAWHEQGSKAILTLVLRLRSDFPFFPFRVGIEPSMLG